MYCETVLKKIMIIHGQFPYPLPNAIFPSFTICILSFYNLRKPMGRYNEFTCIAMLSEITPKRIEPQILFNLFYHAAFLGDPKQTRKHIENGHRTNELRQISVKQFSDYLLCLWPSFHENIFRYSEIKSVTNGYSSVSIRNTKQIYENLRLIGQQNACSTQGIEVKDLTPRSTK